MLSTNVLITGGAGFLGRAIVRRIKREGWDTHITVYSRDEQKQWELNRRWPDVTCILGDVRDPDRLQAAMAGQDIVIHAAAVKYIPEAERNVAECIGVNVEGSLNVARAAARANVRTCIAVSTDKACAPLNTYGATKMLMERMFAEANRWGATRFMSVRYGNVIGSTGSVIPVFRQQIADTGRLKITDPKMTRFWLSADEAVDLIIMARVLADTAMAGSVVIPACPAMTITELAQAVWEEYGTVGGPLQAPIDVMGIRPGEKISEQLYNEAEYPRIHVEGKYFIMAPVASSLKSVVQRSAGMIHPSYDSAQPSRWLNVEEARKMMRDAELI